MRIRASRLRVPIAAVTVVGLGAPGALAVGVSLYLGPSSATENIRRLMAQRSESLVDGLDLRIASQLQPVMRQARWAVEQTERGTVGCATPYTETRSIWRPGSKRSTRSSEPAS